MTITTIRTFESTHTELGVGQREEHVPHCASNYVSVCGDSQRCDCAADSWFVFDHQPGEPWHLHCGPYATREGAEGWIREIREV